MGIDFRHQNGASAQKHLVETMGSGCALLDYDGDGRLDVLLINGGRTPDSPPFEPRPHALYRNRGGGRLQEVTPEAGLEAPAAYGMGVAVGDYDNDGDPDVYLTNFGPNRLFRNNGDGTFSDVTRGAGVAGAEWSTSAAFFDYDRDGAPDLYVVNYLDATFERNPPCEMKGIRAYCHPRHYAGVADRLYRNLGGGRFRDVSRSSGILNPEGKGLGVVAADFDQDGWVDLYVANDSVRNFLFKNKRGRDLCRHHPSFGDRLQQPGPGRSRDGRGCGRLRRGPSPRHCRDQLRPGDQRPLPLPGKLAVRGRALEVRPGAEGPLPAGLRRRLSGLRQRRGPGPAGGQRTRGGQHRTRSSPTSPIPSPISCSKTGEGDSWSTSPSTAGRRQPSRG